MDEPTTLPRIGTGAPTFDEESSAHQNGNGNGRDPSRVSGEVVQQRAESADDGPERRYLDAEAIFAIDDIVTKEVWVPEWKTYIILISLTGDERDKYLNSVQYMDKRGRQRTDFTKSNARLLALGARRKDGGHLFNLHQVERLQQKNSGVVARLANIVSEMSGLGANDDEDKERREGLD